MSWIKSLRAELSKREELPVQELYTIFEPGQSISINELTGALKQFEYEFGIRIGFLRPQDSLKLFLEPPQSANPFAHLLSRLAAGDRGGEINHQLIQHRRKKGVRDLPSQIPKTLREFVLAWAGKDDFDPGS